MSWHECSLHVLGYTNARYKKYATYDQAVDAYNASRTAGYAYFCFPYWFT